MGCALFRRRPALRHTHLLSSTDLIVSTNLCCRHESRGRGDQARHHMSGDGWMDGWVHQTLTGCGRVGRLRRPLGTSRLACLGQLLLRRVPKGVAGGPPVQGRVGQHHGARVAGVLLQRRPRPAADGRAGRRKVRTQGVAGGGSVAGGLGGQEGRVGRRGHCRARGVRRHAGTQVPPLYPAPLLLTWAAQPGCAAARGGGGHKLKPISRHTRNSSAAWQRGSGRQQGQL